MTAARFTTRESACLISIAVVAGCVPALQPMLLGGLLAEGRLSAADIGRAATMEGLGMAIATMVATMLLKPERLRIIGSVALLLAAAANLATLHLPPAGIIAARAASGLANGLLLWLLVGMFARAQVPARLFAIYVTAQASGSFLLTALFAAVALPRFGVAGAYGMLAATDALLLAAVVNIPRRYAPIAAGEAARRGLPALGAAALLAVLLNLAAIMALWVYLAPLGQQAGQSEASLRTMISVANGVQILGGLAACWLATRLSGTTVVLTGAAISLGCVLALDQSATVVWFGATAVFAFLWMFTPPFHLPFLIEADPSRRAALFVGAAQLLGVACGPLLASLAISGRDVAGARIVSMGCFVAVTAIAALVRVGARRSAAAG